MFIGWISQMIALMDKSEGEGVEEILMSIATSYPQVCLLYNCGCVLACIKYTCTIPIEVY